MSPATPRRPGRPGTAAAAVVASALLGSARPALGWGPVAHQAVTARAIDTLPGSLKSYYRNHRLELPSQSLEEPPPAEEGPERRFPADRLMAFPFFGFPRTERSLGERFGDAAKEIGRLPWLIQESYGRLVEAFRSGDKGKILAESDTLAAVVTDLHNPLALTENFDGQKTGQHGLWVRFSVRLPEVMEKRLKLSSDAAAFLDDPREHVFSMAGYAYVWLDNLIYHEELSKRGKSGYTEIYYEALELRAGPILRERLGLSAQDVGSYWYTAWTSAGRPDLK